VNKPWSTKDSNHNTLYHRYVMTPSEKKLQINREVVLHRNDASSRERPSIITTKFEELEFLERLGTPQSVTDFGDIQ